MVFDTANRSSSLDGRQALVYVVDDDTASRESIGAVIATLGYPVECYRTGEDFLQAYRSDVPSCLVIDYRLPGVTGLEVQQQLQSRGATLPVILVSGHADISTAVSAMQQGAVTVLEKPYRAEQLESAIKTAIDLDLRRRARREAIRQARTRLSQLDDKEREVLQFMIEGKPNKIVAKALGVGLRTVERRRHSIFAKTDVETEVQLAELVRLAQEMPETLETPVPPSGHA